MSEWQPIETAPDDKDVLLYDEGTMFVGSKSTFLGQPIFWLGDYTYSPTHWMPLPPHPAPVSWPGVERNEKGD